MVDTKLSLPNDVLINKNSLLSKLPIVFFGLGIVALIYLSVLYQLDPPRAMHGYMFGFAVVLSLGLGCMAFVLIQHVTRAGWSVVVRRIPETIIYLMPIFILFFIPIALHTHEIFPWTHTEHIDEVLAKKLGYLNVDFFLIRSFAYLLCWSLIGVWFYLSSRSQDDGAKTEKTRIMQAISAPGIMIFGTTLTFAAFDWLMSLQPHWYSTIFGVYFFAGSLLFALAFITLMSLLLQKAGYLNKVISLEHYHDLGKLMFGFTVFWAYISFSQFMLIWYANIPEEIEFYTHRMHHGWQVLSWAMPVIHFAIPFFALMSRFLKRVKLVLTINCLWIMAVHLVDLYWLILPTYNDPTVADGPMHLQVGLVDVLALGGLMLVFMGAFLFVFSRNKILALGDPRLKESMAFENF